MAMTGENRSMGRQPVKVSLQHKPHKDCPIIKRGPPQWDDGNQRPKPAQMKSKFVYTMHKNSVRTPHRTQSISIRMANQLILCG